MKTQRRAWARAFPAFSLTALFAFLAPTACDSSPDISVPGGSGGGECLERSEKCGFEGCETSDDCNEGRFCNSFGACQGSCENCGASCSDSAPCKAGQYCSSSGTCEQECVPNFADPKCGKAPTGETYLCGPDGRCTTTPEPEDPGLEFSGGSGNQGTGGGDAGGPGCIDQEVEFRPEVPNVVLLIDQSRSMTDEGNFGSLVDQEIAAGTYVPWGCPENPEDPPDSPEQQDADWRWNVVRNVLFQPDTGIVKQLEESVRFGMALYSSENGNVPSGGGEVRECPMLTEVPIIEDEMNFGNYDEMLAAMQCSDLITDTPTRESLKAVAEKLYAAELDGPKIIVLATDGLPDSCDCPNFERISTIPDACYDDASQIPGEDLEEEAYWVMRGDPPVLMPPSAAEQYDVVQEAKRIYEELGIVVHIVDVSTPNNPTLRQHLTEVAEAGGGEIFDGTRPSGLVESFQTIVDGVRSCVIDLAGEILEGKESEGTVLIDGEEIAFLPDGEGDGWRLNTKSQIELVGEPCETIKSGQHDIDIDFPCDVFIPEPGIY